MGCFYFSLALLALHAVSFMKSLFNFPLQEKLGSLVCGKKGTQGS